MSNGTLIEEPKADEPEDDAGEEVSNRSMDAEIRAMNQIMRSIKAQSPDARTYLLARLRKAVEG